MHTYEGWAFVSNRKDSLIVIIMSKVQRTDEALWEQCKEEVVTTMGKFSARAMQRAVLLYKERGGGYVGTKSTSNPLIVWDKKQKQQKTELEN
jgi:hypothetical protein